MKKIIMLSGLPGSGKSTIISKMQNVKVFKDDIVRKENNLSDSKTDSLILCKIREDFIKKHCESNEDLVLDDVWSSMKSRKEIYSIAKEYGYDVEIIMVIASYNTILSRQVDKVQESTILNIARDYQLPEVGVDCDKLLAVSTEDKEIDTFDRIKNLVDVQHDSIHHLESIGTHIRMVYQLIQEANLTIFENEVLSTVAKYHDLGKEYAKEYKYGRAKFIGYANISALEYLAFNLKNEITDISNTKEYFIASIISSHMKGPENADSIFDYTFNNYTLKDMVLKFSEFDYLGRIATPMDVLYSTESTVQCCKYIFTHVYSPVGYYYKVLNAIEYYHLTAKEVKDIIESSKVYFKMRSSIYDIDNNCIANGLEAFFNIGQFDWIEINSSPEANVWKEFFITLGQPIGKTKEFPKVDGSLIQIVKIGNDIAVHTRGSFIESFSFLKQKNPVETMHNLANELLTKENINLKNGEVLYAEVIGSKAKVVLNYNTDLELIPLVYIDKDNNKKHFNTNYSEDLILNDFSEGVVVVDETKRMFKSKTKEYFEAHGLVDIKFKDFNILNIYINDNLDDVSFLYHTEEEMKVVLHICKTLDAIFDFKNKTFQECKEADKTLEFNILKRISSKEELVEICSNDIYYFLLIDKKVDNELNMKMKDKRIYLSQNSSKYESYYNEQILNNKERTLDVIQEGKKIDPFIQMVYKVINRELDKVLECL